MILNERNFNKEIQEIKKISVPGMNPDQKKRRENLLMAAIGAETNQTTERNIKQERKFSMNPMNPIARYALTTFVGLGLVGGTVFASNAAKPGDFLFPVKRAAETARVKMTISQESQAELQGDIAEKRIEEVEQVDAEHKDEAKAEAASEVNDSIQALTKVQADLTAKGNTKAAEQITKNIARLQSKALELKLDVKDSVDTENDIKDTEVKETEDNNDTEDNNKADSKPAGHSAEKQNGNNDQGENNNDSN